MASTIRLWTLGTEVLSDSGQQFDVICTGPTLSRDEGVEVVELDAMLDLLEHAKGRSYTIDQFLREHGR